MAAAAASAYDGALPKRRRSPQHTVAGIIAVAGSILACNPHPTAAFVSPSSTINPPGGTPAVVADSSNGRGALYQQADSAVERGEMILANDADATDRLLNSAFSSLGKKDKYDTVLTGLCAKVIDAGAANAREGMIDPIRLLEEMNSSRIQAGPRGIIGLIDVSFFAAPRVHVACAQLSRSSSSLYPLLPCVINHNETEIRQRRSRPTRE